MVEVWWAGEHGPIKHSEIHFITQYVVTKLLQRWVKVWNYVKFKIGLKFQVELAETSFFLNYLLFICRAARPHVTLLLFQPLEFLISKLSSFQLRVNTLNLIIQCGGGEINAKKLKINK